MEITITQEKRKEIERIQKEFQNSLSEGEILRSTAQGINSALSRTIPKIKKQIKSEYNVIQKYLTRMAIVSPKANSGRLYGGIKIKYSPIPIIAFKPKQTQGNITVAIHKGKTVVIPKAFIATMATGHKGVYSRGKYEGKGKNSRFIYAKMKTKTGKVMITERITTSPFAMARYKNVVDDVQEYMSKEAMARVTGILKYKVNKIKN